MLHRSTGEQIRNHVAMDAAIAAYVDHLESNLMGISTAAARQQEADLLAAEEWALDLDTERKRTSLPMAFPGQGAGRTAPCRPRRGAET